MPSLATKSFHVALELTATSPLAPSDYWIELTNPPALDLVAEPRKVVRVRAADLREAQRLRAGIRADAVAAGRDPDSVAVLLDIDTIVAESADSARSELAQAGSPQGRAISYIGTAKGLAGLIADIRAAEVADGVTLRPLAGPGTLEFIVCDVSANLRERGLPIGSPNLSQVVPAFRRAS
ncbi:hypothetical protein [Antrihabitans sp. YC2-6]|uniref:hypothetical protein n=1 Tax=Antrihabitans sp. YC2-6 TaxID=2799498 RepID=UPI0018F54A65|nr:hypothetical protein [Antrihabitans sp. YC2-6]MBJ8346001.1 hypothetical protein [Antrihabitans sp. YC2-6]